MFDKLCGKRDRKRRRKDEISTSTQDSQESDSQEEVINETKTEI